MKLEKIEIEEKGFPKMIDAVNIHGKQYTITGRFLKKAVIHDEWHEIVEDPPIEEMKKMKGLVDIFTFKQSLLDQVPKHTYYMDKEAVSALPISTYDHWLEKQVPASTRKNVRKAPRRGVEIKVVGLDDELVEGIMGIYNESPIKRGKPFWHYQKDFDTVKKGMMLEAQNSDFICAFYGDELIGFIKLMYRGELAHPVQILAKNSHRDKFVMNSLIAKAVELCVAKGKKFITYTAWRHGSQAEFLIRNGFIKINLPRYYIPLTIKGKIAMALGIHRSLKERIPEKIYVLLLKLRGAWYSRKQKLTRAE